MIMYDGIAKPNVDWKLGIYSFNILAYIHNLPPSLAKWWCQGIDSNKGIHMASAYNKVSFNHGYIIYDLYCIIISMI